jgi:3-oxoacyl-[acyl-carrier-protein] synthase II
MAPGIQFAVAAADMAFQDAGLTDSNADPDRLGVAFGADMIQGHPDEVTTAYRRCLVDGRFDFNRWGAESMAEINPLWMLKYLPNMAACQITIALNARGPNNTHSLGGVASISAIAEAARDIERAAADVMISGGTGSRIHPTTAVLDSLCEVSTSVRDPETVSRPFDAHRDGYVNGEGAAAFILESREHADARGARILARVASQASAFEPPAPDREREGTAIRAVLIAALERSGLGPSEIGHVNANGLSTLADDRTEARAIRTVLGDTPVTAIKSLIGNLGSGAGAVEMAASLLAFEHNEVPATRNYDDPDPECPVNVIHGKPLGGAAPTALLLNHSSGGQSAALVLTK